MSARCYPDRVMAVRSIRFDHIIFKCYAFRVIFLEPAVRGNLIGKDLEVVGISNLFVGVDIDPNGCHRSLFSLRFPQCVSLRSGLNVRSTSRFNAHDADASEHRRPVMFGDEQQGLHRVLPFVGVVLCLGQFGDVFCGVA